MKSIVMMLACCVLTGCGEFVEADRAVGAVEDLGFTDVRVVDRSNVFPQLYGCDKREVVAFKVEGKNPRGNTVNVTVCCGMVLKGCTVRH